MHKCMSTRKYEMDWLFLHKMHVSVFINATVFTSLLKEEHSAQIINRWQMIDQQHSGTVWQHTERKREHLQKRRINRGYGGHYDCWSGLLEGEVALFLCVDALKQ